MNTVISSDLKRSVNHIFRVKVLKPYSSSMLKW